jgi:lipoate---protein ligase
VAEDLALDEAFLIEADYGRGMPLLRLWEPGQYAVVMGASRRVTDDIKVDECRADDVPILRRSSGGGTVVVGPGTLCVSVFLPESAAPELRSVDLAQRYVLESIAGAIRRTGLAVELHGRADLTLEYRKFAGSAQRRLHHWLMVHCSILFDFDLERIERYLRMPGRQPEYRGGRSHRDFLCNLGVECRLLKDAIRAGCTAGDCPSSSLNLPAGLVASLLSDRFSNRAWINKQGPEKKDEG